MRGEKNLEGSEFQQEMPCLAFCWPKRSSKVQVGGNCKGPIQVSHAILKS